jgi:hypothetical protein
VSLFPAGEIVIMPCARDRIAPELIKDGIDRHLRGDWGDLLTPDKAVNDHGVRRGYRLLSVYHAAGEKFWVLTAADRSTTTVLLPEEFH